MVQKNSSKRNPLIRSLSRFVLGFTFFCLTMTMFQNCSAPFAVLESVNLASTASRLAVISLSNQPAQFTKSAEYSATLFISNKPTGSEVVCEFDGLPLTPCDNGTNLSFVDLQDGNHTLHIALNSSEKIGLGEVNVSWSVDTKAPVITINGTPPLETSALSYSFSGQVADQGSGVDKIECAFQDAPFVACALPLAGAVTANGTYNLKVRASDKVGNVAAVYSHGWEVRPDIPSVTIDKMPAAFNRVASFEIAFSGVEGSTPLTSFECSQTETGKFTACTSPVALTNRFIYNERVFRVRAKGTIDPTKYSSPAIYRWVDDTAPPLIKIDATIPALTKQYGTMFYSNSFSQIFTFTVTDQSNTQTTQCALDTMPYATCSNRVTLNGLTEGPHSLKIRGVDAAGNAAVSTQYWTVDRMPPVIEKLRYSSNGPLNQPGSGDVHFSITATDAFFGTLVMSINGGAFTPLNVPNSYTPRPGQHEAVWSGLLPNQEAILMVKAIDMVGNESEPMGPYQFNYTLIKPVSEVSLPESLLIDGLTYPCHLQYVVENTAATVCTYLNITNREDVKERSFFVTYDISANQIIEKSRFFFDQSGANVVYVEPGRVGLSVTRVDNRRYIIGSDFFSYTSQADGTLTPAGGGPGSTWTGIIGGDFIFSPGAFSASSPMYVQSLNYPSVPTLITTDAGKLVNFNYMRANKFVATDSTGDTNRYRFENGSVIVESKLPILNGVYTYASGKISARTSAEDDALIDAETNAVLDQTTANREARLPSFSPYRNIDIGTANRFYSNGDYGYPIYSVVNNKVARMLGWIDTTTGVIGSGWNNPSNRFWFNDVTKTISGGTQSLHGGPIRVYLWKF